MPVPTSISGLSPTPSSNSPQGTETVGPIMNQYIQAAYAFIAQIYAGSLNPTSALNFNGQKITNVANGVASTDVATVGQIGSAYVPLAGGVTLTGALTMPNITLNTPDAGGALVRFINGNYGAMLRNDGAYAYLLSTASGSQSGNANAYRPFYWNLGTGAVTVDGTGIGATFGGAITASGNITAFSDESLKKDWESLPENFVEILAEVLSGTYTRIDTGERQVGVGAQSFQKAIPEAVIGGEKLSVAYGNAALAAAVKLAQRLLQAEKRIAALEQAK